MDILYTYHHHLRLRRPPHPLPALQSLIFHVPNSLPGKARGLSWASSWPSSRPLPPPSTSRSESGCPEPASHREGQLKARFPDLCPISIMGSLIWNATTSVSSARIISLPPAPPAPTVPRLQLRSFMVGSTFVGTSTSVKRIRQPNPPCLGSSSGLSWIPFGIELSETPSTSRRKFRIGHLTSSISNPSLLSLMLTGLQKRPLSFNTSEKGSSHR